MGLGDTPVPYGADGMRAKSLVRVGFAT
jgi:hypothetical protein